MQQQEHLFNNMSGHHFLDLGQRHREQPADHGTYVPLNSFSCSIYCMTYVYVALVLHCDIIVQRSQSSRVMCQLCKVMQWQRQYSIQRPRAGSFTLSWMYILPPFLFCCSLESA